MKNKRRLNPALVKSKRAYSLFEIAELYGKHIRTVQMWRKQGLKVVDENAKPFLVIGSELKRFLKERNNAHKTKLSDNEFFCMKCRSAKLSIPDKITIEYTKKVVGRGQLQVIIRGTCQSCFSKLCRFSTEQKIKGLYDTKEKYLNINCEQQSLPKR